MRALEQFSAAVASSEHDVRLDVAAFSIAACAHPALDRLAASIIVTIRAFMSLLDGGQGTVVCVVSGGNIDAAVLAKILAGLVP